MTNLKITMEIETEKNKEIIEPYLRFNLKMLKIKDIKIEGIK